MSLYVVFCRIIPFLKPNQYISTDPLIYTSYWNSQQKTRIRFISNKRLILISIYYFSLIPDKNALENERKTCSPLTSPTECFIIIVIPAAIDFSNYDTKIITEYMSEAHSHKNTFGFEYIITNFHPKNKTNRDFLEKVLGAGLISIG